MNPNNITSDPQLYVEMYNEMPAICTLINSQFMIISINHYGCEQLGYLSDDLIGLPVINIYKEEERQFICSNLEALINAKESTSKRWEGTITRNDKSDLWVKDTAKRINLQNSKDQHILLVSEDITETRYLINELEKQTSNDMLTGLVNRNKFERYIDQAFISTQTSQNTYGLCYIDIDRFKVVNEISGHVAGDELLKQVTNNILPIIRSEDILARLDSDKFGLLLSHCHAFKVEEILNKILDSITQSHFHWKDEVFNVSASAGYLMIDHTSSDSADCITMAGTACSVAKNNALKNIHCYNSSDKELIQHSQLQKNIAQLNWAFENEQLVLHYQEIQPVSATSDTKHLEVLIRLKNKENNLVYPDAIIPAAEHYGQATKLDLWVTQTALKHYSRVCDQQKVICNINLSGKTLGSQEFINEATKFLQRYQNPSLVVCFEVTETSAISNMNKAVDFIQHFKDLGCQFALDDFGSGFSSFAYLKSLPVDYLKIDGYFVKNIMQNPKDLALVRAIHQVAEIFEIKTIAEFIEDEAIMTVLKGVGIHFGQGYHLHKPEEINNNNNVES